MIERLILSMLSNLKDLEMNPIKVHHQRLPQLNSKNGVVYQNISTPVTYCKGGKPEQDSARFQIDIYHQKDTEAHNLTNQIRTTLEGWHGVFEGTRFNYTTVENLKNSYDETMTLHRTTMDFIFRKTNS